MTGESESHNPMVLKLPKAVWLRATARIAATKSEFGDSGGNKDSSTSNKFRKRPLRRTDRAEAVISYIRAVDRGISDERKRELVQTDPKEYETNAIGCMSYAEVSSHIINLRLEYLQRLLRPLLQKLMLHPRNAGLFNTPVDPVALTLYDYFIRIKEPMDLGTVKSKLQSGHYTTVQQCFDDIDLVFRNAILYNGDNSSVSATAKLIQADFQAEMQAINEKLEKDVSHYPIQIAFILS
jgi:hypothetical protein